LLIQKEKDKSSDDFNEESEGSGSKDFFDKVIKLAEVKAIL